MRTAAELEKLLTECTEALDACRAYGTPTPKDAEILAAMLDCHDNLTGELAEAHYLEAVDRLWAIILDTLPGRLCLRILDWLAPRLQRL